MEKENNKDKKNKIGKKIDIIGLIILLLFALIFIGTEIIISRMNSVKDKFSYLVIEFEEYENFKHKDYKFVTSVEEYKEIIDKYLESDDKKIYNYNYDVIIGEESNFFEDNKILVLCISNLNHNLERIKVYENEISIEISRIFSTVTDKDFVFIMPVSKNIDTVNIGYKNRLIVRCMDIFIYSLKICAIWMIICFIYTLIRRQEGYKKILARDFALVIMLMIFRLILILITYYSSN